VLIFHVEPLDGVHSPFVRVVEFVVDVRLPGDAIFVDFNFISIFLIKSVGVGKHTLGNETTRSSNLVGTSDFYAIFVLESVSISIYGEVP
jgi:hypothetical protein